MNNTFRRWERIGNMDLESAVGYILTGRTVKEALPDKWLLQFLNPSLNLKILDFGCGVGRNTFYMAKSSPLWVVVGYDNEGMLSKTKEFYNVHYEGEIPSNVSFTSNWESLSKQSFDVIICHLVLQHIFEESLGQYLTNFKEMTSRLVVFGRRHNDEKKRSTWTILEENGLTPIHFYNFHGEELIPTIYMADGNSEQHNIAEYFL